MSKLLLNLRHVPDDEADDVRALLDANRIGFYETAPSFWGLSGGGIWIDDDAQVAEAKRLMADYQSARATRMRAEYAAARRDGTAETIWTVLRTQPLKVLVILAAIAFLLYLTALPVLLLNR